MLYKLSLKKQTLGIFFTKTSLKIRFLEIKMSRQECKVNEFIIKNALRFLSSNPTQIRATELLVSLANLAGGGY